MKQTAIQELISELKKLKQTKVFRPSLKAIDDCINLAYANMEKEQQQIEDAYIMGRYNSSLEIIMPDKFYAKDYYNEIFKSE